MNNLQIEKLTESIKDKKNDDRFNIVKSKVNEMKQCIENLECIYETLSENDIKKRLLDISYKHAFIMDFIMSFNKKPNTNEVETEGKKENNKAFAIHENNDGSITIKTPFPPVKCLDARTETSKIFALHIEKLLHDMCVATGKSTPIFKKANVHFHILIGNEISSNNIPDADNLDLKSILDSLQNYLIPNDNLITIGYKVTGERTDNTSAMLITIASDHDNIFKVF